MRIRTGAIPGVVAVAAAVLGVAGTPRLTAQQVPAEQTPAFRSGVEAVTVDVGVVDRQGQPMRGLAPRTSS